MKTPSKHASNGTGDVPMPEEQVQVHIAAYGRVTVGKHGDQRTFDENGVDKVAREILQNAKEFSGHTQAEQMLRAHTDLELSRTAAGTLSKASSSRRFATTP
jgi:hypothetical protein